MSNTLKLSLIGVFIAIVALAQAPTDKENQYVRLKTQVINGGFENGASAWSASGGVFAVSTTLTDTRSGLRGAYFDASAAAQTLTSAANTVSAGNAQVSCWFKTAATDYEFAAYDGTNKVVTQTIPATTIFQKITLNYAPSASGQLRARITSASNAAQLYVDDCFVGEADNYGTGNYATDWLPLPSMSTDNFGTITALTANYRRVGGELQVRGYFLAATTVAATAAIGLPTGLTIDTAKISTATNAQLVGWTNNLVSGGAASLTSTDKAPVLFFDGSSTTKVFFAYQGGAGIYNKVNASTLYATGHGVSFYYAVPIVGWAAQSVWDANVNPAYWSGYHDATCSWSTTGTTFADFGAGDASCGFTQVLNNNFGTVSSYLISGNNGPGITFTPTRSGVYEICADLTSFGPATTFSRQAHRIYDGTNTAGQSEYQTQNTNQAVEGHKICGFINASSVTSKTYYIQSLTGTGTIQIGAPTASSLAAVYWTIKQLSAVATAPLLTGNVTSNSTGSERIERAFVTASTAVVSRNSSSWLSVNRTSAGLYTLTFTTGTWSSAPVCTATIESSVGMGFWRFNNTMTTTSVGVSISNTADSANVDRDFNLICIGPK